MARGQVTEGEKQAQLESGEDAALAREALGEAEAPAEPEAEAPEAAPAESEVMRRGLTKTRQGFMAKLNALITGGGLDEDLVDELESLLVTSDIGIRTSERLLGDIRSQLSRKEIKDPEVVRTKLKAKVAELVRLDRPPMDWGKGPTVLMVIGVNGVGKTTTIGKLAARLTREGKKVVLAAGDTFRAAAVEQLEVWGQRAGAEVVKGAEGADPASVIFEGVQRAKAVGADVCIADTAGRLHTKVNLMEELKKVRRVMDKAMPGAPHEVMMVLDATTGQNAIQQAKQFKAAVEMSSIALTKLDGTAKGGVVVAICDEIGVPVRYVGIGEQVDDLRDFDPDAFVDALFAED
ncbi:MAG: signal recognition particle-docking protein FtsY [Myxococcales bacterium]|nr:signal recognition particle-docking protein FtsY [Myxococcales bacterium]MCB9645872.1 signal recognition particle-docking protein FtsY [Deltaproteobacteria bacterium]